jgi:hypothetical protein
LIEPPATANRFSLLPLAASFAAGIALGRHGPELTWPWVWFLALLTLILLNHRSPGRHSGRLATVLLWLLFGLAGLLRFTTLPLAEIPSSLAPQLDSGQEVVISGRLTQPPSFDGRRGKILVAADQHWQKDGVIAPLNLPLPLSMPFAPSADLKPGDRILLRATLQRPAPPGNPGTFDYRRYLADRSILATGFIRSPANLTVIHESDPAAVDLLAGLSFRVQRWRQQINLFIAGTGLDPKNVGLYQALLTGDRSLLPLNSERGFQKFRPLSPAGHIRHAPGSSGHAQRPADQSAAAALDHPAGQLFLPENHRRSGSPGSLPIRSPGRTATPGDTGPDHGRCFYRGAASRSSHHSGQQPGIGRPVDPGLAACRRLPTLISALLPGGCRHFRV